MTFIIIITNGEKKTYRKISFMITKISYCKYACYNECILTIKILYIY